LKTLRLPVTAGFMFADLLMHTIRKVKNARTTLNLLRNQHKALLKTESASNAAGAYFSMMFIFASQQENSFSHLPTFEELDRFEE
jgi:hypothetical protein